MSNVRIDVFKDAEELARAAAEDIIELFKYREHEYFSIALSGGTTPRTLYEMLSSEEFAPQIEWDKVIFIFGDERNVQPDSDESNFKMVNNALFRPLEIQEENIVRFKTELGDPTKIASEFRRDIFDHFDEEMPRIDLVLLGLGDDGHTASLFPETAAMDEESLFAVENFVPKFDKFRYTLTFTAINAAAKVMFLVTGEQKADVVKNILTKGARSNYPAGFVLPENGDVTWMLDKAVASKL